MFVVLFFSLWSCLSWCSGYNIDTRTSNGLVFKSRSGDGNDDRSYFGYSLSLTAVQTTPELVDVSLFVGAPRGKVNTISEVRGNLYKCEFRGSTECDHENLDGAASDDKKERKKEQWLGATVYSGGFNKASVVCAPRYTEKVLGRNGEFDYFMTGKCYTFWERESQARQVLVPCSGFKVDGFNAKDRQVDGFCMTGLSASVKDKSGTVSMGAPGARFKYWYGEKGGLYLQKNRNGGAATLQFYTTNTDSLQSNDYMGYSLTTGNFRSSKPADEEIATGLPRAGIHGKVRVYTGYPKQFDTFEPPRTVSEKKEYIYFGAAVCAVDVNGDGYSDLIVGAPFYSDQGDEGRVYVFLNQRSTKPIRLSVSSEDDVDPGLRGNNNPGARFGWAIARAGDLNNDGIDDFIVGAPQDQPDIDNNGFGNGAIYIYHGSKDGKINKYKQRISAKDVQNYYIFSQFGYAVSGNVDTNEDEYPDIAIGAWESARALVLRTRPVIDLNRSLTLSKREIPVDNVNTTANCTDGSDKRQCLDAVVCFSYQGKSVSGPRELTYTFEVDADQRSKRVYMRDSQGSKVYDNRSSLVMKDKTNQTCITFGPIFVEDGLAETLSSENNVVFEFNYDLVNDSACNTTKLCPVLDDRQLPSRVREKATLIVNCSDNTCDYDMGVQLSLSPWNVTIGVEEEVFATVVLSNNGEKVYNPEITVLHDPALQYVKFKSDDTSLRIQKRTIKSGNVTTSELFRLQGILENDKQFAFTLQYSSKNVQGNRKELLINVKADAETGQEANVKDNNATVYVKVLRDVKLTIAGQSVPKASTYPIKPRLEGYGNLTNFTNVNASLVGPLVKVTFVLNNEGASPIQDVKFFIKYPLKEFGAGNEQKYFVYPISVEIQDGGNGFCDKKNYNPERLVLDVKDRQKRAATELSVRTKQGDTISCNVTELGEKTRFAVVFTFRIWEQTMSSLHPKDLLLAIEAEANYKDDLSGKQYNRKNTVTIRLTPENPAAKSKDTPVWIIIVAVLGGVLLLAIAIFALFKFGFFKRNRPPKDISAPQTEDPPAAVVPQ